MPNSTPSSTLSRHFPWLALLGFLTLAALGTPLYSTGTVLSSGSADLANQFLYSRAFGFGEMASGHLPAWNPYIYGGVPFLGDFQSALLYPLNLIFLVLPLAAAINWSFALHVFLLGAGSYAWGARRGLQPAAAFLTGVAAMFSGAFFLHIYAGHLSNVCTMAWVPFVFLGIDGWLASRHAKWIFLAGAAAAAQIYAGHPQYVYYTALIAGLYALAHLIKAEKWPVAALGLIAIYPLAALLAAAQLLPGFFAASEAVRSGGVSYDFASMFSFPPENLATLVAPWFFGDMATVPYWGRCYLWEMSFFAGTGMVLLACHGTASRESRPAVTRLLILLAAALLLALGRHTPLHQLFYHVLPGFSAFRGASKFLFFGSLFLALLAGMGADRILRRQFPAPALAVIGLVAGAILLVAGLVLGNQSFHDFAAQAIASKESYLNPAVLERADIVQSFQKLGTRSLLIAGVSLAAFAGLFLATRRSRVAVWAVWIAAVAELLIFARGSTAFFPLRDFTYPPIADFLKQNPGDYRTLNLFNPDSAMLLRSENVWGYDPTVLKRYAQLLFVSQGLDPKEAGQYLPFRQSHPILALLRCKLAFVPKDGQISSTPITEKPFPRFFVVSEYEVTKNADAALQALKDPSFNFGSKVLLEQEPIPAPEKEGGKYQIRVIKATTDEWLINIVTERAGILVMTDSYSKDWVATAMPGSVQVSYNLLPADHALRAIPLAAGTHNIKIEYQPSGFGTGILITLITLALLAASLGWKPARERLDCSDWETEHLLRWMKKA